MRAVLISESEQDEQTRDARADEDRMLAALLHNADRSIAELACACHWILTNGEPHKSKTYRTLERLQKSRLVKNHRGRWVLTEEGKTTAKRAAGLDDDAEKSELAKPRNRAKSHKR